MVSQVAFDSFKTFTVVHVILWNILLYIKPSKALPYIYKKKSLFVFSAEALHLGSLMSAHGYFFPIDDHVLTVKNDNTYYRFQVL